MLFSPQLPLNLEPRRDDRFEHFVAGPNAATVAKVKAIVDEPGSSLFLYGPEASGKSHLLNAACREARERGMTAYYVGLARLPDGGQESLRGLGQMDLVCLDDVERVAGHDEWEKAIFNLVNRLHERRGRIIFASCARLKSLPLRLPDLASRLAWGLRAQLLPLADADKMKVMRAHAETLGIELPDDVAAYLLRHGPRRLPRLIDQVGRLQHAAFTAKRRITVPLAREVLQSTPGDGG